MLTNITGLDQRADMQRPRSENRGAEGTCPWGVALALDGPRDSRKTVSSNWPSRLGEVVPVVQQDDSLVDDVVFAVDGELDDLSGLQRKRHRVDTSRGVALCDLDEAGPQGTLVGGKHGVNLAAGGVEPHEACLGRLERVPDRSSAIAQVSVGRLPRLSSRP